MSENSMTNVFPLIFAFTLMVSIITGMLLITYVGLHDYAGVELVNIGEDLTAKNITDSRYTNAMESVLIKSQKFPNFLDKLFLGVFAIFYLSVLTSAYRTKREGYFSFYGYTFLGSMIFLFILSYYLEVSEWIKNLLFSVIPSISPSIPFFSWYLNNAGIFNMVFIFLCFILSFIDFDLSRFNTRKDKEMINDEI